MRRSALPGPPHSPRSAPRNRSHRRGVALVELAVILPLLMLFLVGVWEVGRTVQVQQIMTMAVREGGRQASLGNKTTSEVQNAVVTYLNVQGITGVSAANVTVTNLTDPSRDPS